MYKKILSALLAVALLLSVSAVFVAEGEIRGSVTQRPLETLYSDLVAFTQQALQVANRDTAATPDVRTTRLKEKRAQGIELQNRYAETQAYADEVERFLVNIYGGWDATWDNGDGSFGAYVGISMPYIPLLNAYCLWEEGLDNFLARDPVYGYTKLMPQFGIVTQRAYVVKEPEVWRDVDGESVRVRRAVYYPTSDEEHRVMERVEAWTPTMRINPGRYTEASWQHLIDVNNELMRLCEFQADGSIPILSETTVSMAEKLQKYRDAYNGLELTDAEKDPTLSEEQKAEARRTVMLRSILALLLDESKASAAQTDKTANNPFLYGVDYDEWFTRQDGSTTQAKLDEVNAWYESQGLAFRIELSTDETNKHAAQAWLEAARAAYADPNATADELAQFIDENEYYDSGADGWLPVAEAEDPDAVRAEYVTSVTQFSRYRDEVLGEFYDNTLCGQRYREARNGMTVSVLADQAMGRYDSPEAKAAFEEFSKACEPGDQLMQVTDRIIYESEYWAALESVMAAYEKLIPLRSDAPAHQLIYDSVKAFKDTADASIYTPESWSAFETAFADYETYAASVEDLIRQINETSDFDLSPAQKADAVAEITETVNAKAYAMNDAFYALTLLDQKALSDEMYAAANKIFESARDMYGFLDGTDMPYTVESFERFVAAYEALAEAMDIVKAERGASGGTLTYGDRDLMQLITQLVTAQAGLIYLPNTCN